MFNVIQQSRGDMHSSSTICMLEDVWNAFTSYCDTMQHNIAENNVSVKVSNDSVLAKSFNIGRRIVLQNKSENIQECRMGVPPDMKFISRD